MGKLSVTYSVSSDTKVLETLLVRAATFLVLIHRTEVQRMLRNDFWIVNAQGSAFLVTPQFPWNLRAFEIIDSGNKRPHAREIFPEKLMQSRLQIKFLSFLISTKFSPMIFNDVQQKSSRNSMNLEHGKIFLQPITDSTYSISSNIALDLKSSKQASVRTVLPSQ